MDEYKCIKCHKKDVRKTKNIIDNKIIEYLDIFCEECRDEEEKNRNNETFCVDCGCSLTKIETSIGKIQCNICQNEQFKNDMKENVCTMCHIQPQLNLLNKALTKTSFCKDCQKKWQTATSIWMKNHREVMKYDG